MSIQAGISHLQEQQFDILANWHKIEKYKHARVCLALYYTSSL